jgi:hypothetical protein
MVFRFGTETPKGHAVPTVIHQSDISSWSRCPEAYRLGKAGVARNQTSALAYGSVMHHAVYVLERYRSLEKAIATFKHYWHPHNIEAICDPVDTWLPRQTYSILLERGIESLTRLWDTLQLQDYEVLGLEFSFVVPILGTSDVDGEPLYLGGTIDRLIMREIKRKPVLFVEDAKSGKKYRNLRQNLQGTAYVYATERPEFWMGDSRFYLPGFPDGEKVFKELEGVERRFTWLDLNESAFHPGGTRTDQDYRRFAKAAQGVYDSIQAGIYTLNISGDTCTYCEFKEVCGGIGLSED